jgi:hypothetical protein
MLREKKINHIFKIVCHIHLSFRNDAAKERRIKITNISIWSVEVNCSTGRSHSHKRRKPNKYKRKA